MRYTPIAYTKYLKGLNKTYLMSRQGKILDALSVKSWDMAPGNTSITPKAYFLDGQLERIKAIIFTPDAVAIMKGGQTITNQPTRAYLLKDVWMLDGAIYKGLHRFVMHHHSKLKPSMYYFPSMVVDTEINDATIYNTYDGHSYFFDWLVDDCCMYPLAASEGVPVTSDLFSHADAPLYESVFEMNPVRTHRAYLKQAIFFDDDWGNNASKHERFMLHRSKLLAKFPNPKHPGVFILRGQTGVSRKLVNELELAQTLQDTYGFRIVDVAKQSAAEIISACVGAQVIVGIEGSHMAHGLMVLEPETSILILQPPHRFTAVLKLTADMAGIHYGFVVGIPKEDGFYIAAEEVQKTIALLPTT
ncbi:glycosyltransferase 61 family protein [Mariniflexile sp.]|uniref:glycosyltransferase 61 family protein n=1 Tax=Mariniflexile sp. TaxID=1979402 RepID=UPI003569B9A7